MLSIIKFFLFIIFSLDINLIMSNSLILNSKEFNNKKISNYHSFKKNVINLNEKLKLENFKISKK